MNKMMTKLGTKLCLVLYKIYQKLPYFLEFDSNYHLLNDLFYAMTSIEEIWCEHILIYKNGGDISEFKGNIENRLKIEGVSNYHTSNGVETDKQIGKMVKYFFKEDGYYDKDWPENSVINRLLKCNEDDKKYVMSVVKKNRDLFIKNIIDFITLYSLAGIKIIDASKNIIKRDTDGLKAEDWEKILK